MPRSLTQQLALLVFVGFGASLLVAPIVDGLLALALVHHGRTVAARVVAHEARTARSGQVWVRTRVAIPVFGREVEAWVEERVPTAVGGAVQITHAPGVPWYAAPAAADVAPFDNLVGRAVSIGLGLLLLTAVWRERRRHDGARAR